MDSSTIDEETRYRLIKRIESNPEISQRELAAELGVSLGKVNYCLKALITMGWVKVGNFTRSNSKLGYAYVVTPAGLHEKAHITARFLKKKRMQYELLKEEIEKLESEVKQDDTR